MAILIAAVLATGLLVLSLVGKRTTVEKAYLDLLDTMLLIYFVPFIYLFLTYIKVRLIEPGPAVMFPRNKPMAVLVGIAGLFLTLFAMGVAMVPPSGTESVWLFELKVVGGASAFMVLGGILYWRARLRRARVKVGAERSPVPAHD
jgi:amino acid transporter